jgi:hypothetical protein
MTQSAGQLFSTMLHSAGLDQHYAAGQKHRILTKWFSAMSHSAEQLVSTMSHSANQLFSAMLAKHWTIVQHYAA